MSFSRLRSRLRDSLKRDRNESARLEKSTRENATKHNERTTLATDTSPPTRSPIKGSPSPIGRLAQPQHNDLWAEAHERAEQALGKKWEKWLKVQKDEWEGYENGKDLVSERLRQIKKDFGDDQWCVTREDGRKIVVTSVVEKVLDAVNNVKGLAAAATRLDPTKAAGVVWAGIELLLSVAKTAVDLRKEVLDQAEELAFIIEVCKTYEESATMTPGATLTLRKSLVSLYAKILEYQVTAYLYLQESKTRSAVRAMAAPKDDQTLLSGKKSYRARFDDVKSASMALDTSNMQAIKEILKGPAPRFSQLLLPVTNLVTDKTIDVASATTTAQVLLPQFDSAQAFLRVESIDLWRWIAAVSKSYLESTEFESRHGRFLNIDLNNGSLLLGDKLQMTTHFDEEAGCIVVKNVGSNAQATQNNEPSPMAHYTGKLPSRAIAQHLFCGPVQGAVQRSFMKGDCGSKYTCSSHPYTPRRPVGLCMSATSEIYRVFRRHDLQVMETLRKRTIEICLVLWKTKGQEETFDKLYEFAHTDVTLSSSHYSLRIPVFTYYRQHSSEYEIEDVARFIEQVLHDSDATYTSERIAHLASQAISFWDERAKYLTLDLLITTHVNTSDAVFLPSNFEKLLVEEYCFLLPPT